MIYLDVSTAVHSRAGLGRYAEQLTAEIAQLRPGGIALFHIQDGSGHLPPALEGLPRRELKIGFKPWRMGVLLAQQLGLGINRVLPDVDLFHSTEHLLLPLRRVPTVITVHDLIFKLFPEYHKPLNYWYLNVAMPLYCRRATAIIAVSEATKRDIVQHYGVDPAKIHVIYEAAADYFAPASPEQIAIVREKYGLPEQYLLHLSTIEPRKNLDRLVDSLLILRQTHPKLKLVLVGSTGWLYEDFLNRLAKERLEEIVLRPGWIKDEDLTAVISGAALAVQPSLYEGFGLPLLEHMACGQVVATSNTSSLPEIGGEAAAYFDPENTAEMTAVINRLLQDPAEVFRRREMGFLQAARFSWRQAAEETLALYDELLEKYAISKI